MTIGVQTGLLDRDPALREMVRRLVSAYEPEFVYLFGSKARGDSGPDSDYDLLVIVPDDASPERRRSQLAYRALRGTGTADGCSMPHDRARVDTKAWLARASGEITDAHPAAWPTWLPRP